MRTQQTEIEKAREQIAKARAQLILRYPFFGTLALYLDVQPARVKTMATDGKHLWFNPTWVNELKFSELVGVVAHEASHCALGHPWRRGARDRKLFNIATDRVINRIVSKDFDLPASRHQAPDLPDTSSEEEYRMLREQQPPPMPSNGGDGDQPAGDGGESAGAASDDDGQADQKDAGDDSGPTPPPGSTGDCGGCGEVIDYPVEATDPLGAIEERERAREQFEVKIAAAAAMAKAAGQFPAGMQIALDQLRKPQIPWTQVVRRHMRETSRDDYSWRRPNRRLIGSDIYMPGRFSKKIGGVLIAVDTSGSTLSYLSHFAGEINGLIMELRPPWVEIIYCDAAVAADVNGNLSDHFEPDQYPVPIKPRGGGGTSFKPVFDYVRERDIQPVCAVYLTDLDGYGDAFGRQPPYPVIWVTTMKDSVPWGEVVRLDTTLDRPRAAA